MSAKRARVVDAALETDESAKIGEVMHYYTQRGVAVVRLSEQLSTIETVCFRSPPGRAPTAAVDFMQTIISMVAESGPVRVARPGQTVAIKVDQRVRRGDFIARR
jgi:hypothetical protein